MADMAQVEAKRSIPQNRKGWALWSDISKQLEWYGNKLTPEQWKELLSHEWKAQIIVPAISGGFCALGCSTSKMRKREFCELVEVTYAFGSERGVEWSDPAEKAYQEFAIRESERVA